MAKLKFAIFVLSFVLLGSEALRFAPEPITVESGILVIGRPAKLTCNYVKFRTESVREITWFAGYNGINTKIFHYHVTAGTKEGSTFSFIKTDEATATDSDLTIVLPEFRSQILTIGCEVEVLRDSGYGKLKTAKKLEEANITVVHSQRHQLIMKAGTDMGSSSQNSDTSYATIGEPFLVKCVSAGVEPGPNLTLHLNGEPWEQNYPGQIFENPLDQGVLYSGNPATKSITGRLSVVSEDMFQSSSSGGYNSGNKVMNVECLAKYGDHVFDRKQMIVKRVDSTGQVNLYSGSGSGSVNPYLSSGSVTPSPYSSRAGSTNPYLSEPGMEDDQYLAPEIGRGGGGDRRPTTYDNQRNTGGFTGSYGQNERHGKVYNNDEIHSRLLDLVDPARHNHPGIPYDFYAGYILMISDNLDEPDQQYGSSSYSSAQAAASTTTLLGKLPDYVITSFQSNYGRYNQISTERCRVKMDPVEVLNILGNFGFRVISSTFTKNSKMIWTIEQRKFENEKSSGSFRGRDL